MIIVHGDLRKRVLSEGESSANIWFHDRESSRMDDLRSLQDLRHGRYSPGSSNSRTSAILRCKMGRSNRRDDIEIQRMRSWKTCTSDSETMRIRSNSHLRRTCKALFKRPNRKTTPSHREWWLATWTRRHERNMSRLVVECAKETHQLWQEPPKAKNKEQLGEEEDIVPDLKGSRGTARPGNRGSGEVWKKERTLTSSRIDKRHQERHESIWETLQDAWFRIQERALH